MNKAQLSDPTQTEHFRYFRRWLAAILFYPALLIALLPLLQSATVYAQNTASNTQLVDGDLVATAPTWTVNLGNSQGSELTAITAAVSSLGADMSGYRRLNVNAVDKAQFDKYLAVNNYVSVLAANKNAPAGLISGQITDITKLSAATKAQLGVDKLSQYSRDLIRSILNEVTPVSTGGAGHEFANVFRITKDFTKKDAVNNETTLKLDEEPRVSQHNQGKAVDISQLDNLRGTQFTIESTVDKEGKPVIKDGKPVEEVLEYKHIDVQPIDFSLQDSRSAGQFPGALPKMYGTTPHSASQELAGKQFGSILNQEMSKRGADVGFDVGGVDLTAAQNLGEATQLYGGAAIESAMENANISLGPNAPLRTGQSILGEATGIPSFGFYGSSLDGAPNGQTSLTINTGREVVGQLLGLPEGSLIGSTSDELYSSTGKRTFEAALGNLPIGTLDGITAGDRRSLETHVGRGVLASRLSLDVSQLPLGASQADFNHALGFQQQALKSAPLAYDTSFNIRDSGATQQLISGALKPDDYLQQIGAARLKGLETYLPNRADAALNLEERPDIATELVDLPTSPNPNTTGESPLTNSESTVATSRANYLLEHFAFKDAAKQTLTEVQQGATKTDLRFILNDTALQAWLLDAAYIKGFDANQPTKVSRFLAADTTSFYDVGTDQVARKIGKDNTERAALRSYFRTGVMPTFDDKITPVVNINNLVGQIGLRSRVGFEVIFRSDAPQTEFEMVGRRSLLSTFGQNQTGMMNQIISPAASNDQIKIRLEVLLGATTDFQIVSTGDVHNSLAQATAVINQLITNVNQVSTASQMATPQAWISSLTNLYQVGQQAAGVSDQHIQEYRNYALALADLAEGDSARGLYALKDASSLYLNSSIGQAAVTGLVDVFGGNASPNTAIRNFGNSAIGQVNGLDDNTSQLLYDLLGAATIQKNATTDDIRSSLTDFAKDHAAEIENAAIALEIDKNGYDLSGNQIKLSDDPDIRSQQLSEGFIALMTQGTGGPASMKLGGNVIDTALGIKDYEVSPDAYGTWGMLSTDIGGTVDQVMQRAQNDQKVWELLTNETNANLGLDEQQERLFGAATAQYALNLIGAGGIFNRRMITDKNYAFTMDEALNIFGSPLFNGESGADKAGQVISSLGIPIIGDIITDRNTLRSFLNGQIFDGASDFWKNQSYLTTIEQYTSQVGVPSGFIKTLFDRTLTGAERTDKLGGVFTDYLKSNVTADFINQQFGFSGTPFESVGQSAISLVNILTDKTITDKGSAIQSLGTQIGDNFIAANFGIAKGISWLWNDKTSSQDKISTGLDVLTQATNFDPAIGSLAKDAYRIFYVGDGIDTNTVKGRQDMMALVNSFGTAANIPTQYLAAAAQGFTGDFAGSLTTLAGQQFTETLAANGITDVRLSDVIQAFGSPSAATAQLASATAWNEIIGSKDPATFAGTGATVEVINPNTGKTELVASETATALSDRANVVIGKATVAAQTNLKYALGDSLLNQALSSQAGEAINARGMTKAMLTGTTAEKATSMIGVITQLTNSPLAAEVFGGIGTANELKTFFASDAKDAKLSAGAQAQLDNYLSTATGLPIPAGSTSAMLSFAKTGDAASFEALVSPTSLVQNFGGFVDQGLGLPSGTTNLAYQASVVYDQAATAVEVAQRGVDSLGSAVTQNAQVALDKANQAMSATTASLVALGVNLVFSKQIAAVDGALGLPQGTTSMLVTAGITALMVPGMTFALLATSVFLPALAVMVIGALFSKDGFKSLFGGGTKKVKRTETFWSYHNSDPVLRPAVESNQKDAAAAQQAKQQLSCKTPEKNLEGACLKPKTELDRGDWPEEAWFKEMDKSKPQIIAPGKNIALLTDKQLPKGIFRGNSQKQFLDNSRLAAKDKISQLLNDLLTINARIFTLGSDGQPVNNPNVFPAQIWTHDKTDVQAKQSLIDAAYGQGHTGSFQEWNKAGFLRGVGFDDNISLLVRWVHWQY